MENGLFTRSGKQDLLVKWQKNVFRFSIVVLCTIISWTGAQDLDKFVAFVGSFAWWVHGLLNPLSHVLTFRVQRSALLRVPTNAALQSMCAHMERESL